MGFIISSLSYRRARGPARRTTTLAGVAGDTKLHSPGRHGQHAQEAGPPRRTPQPCFKLTEQIYGFILCLLGALEGSLRVRRQASGVLVGPRFRLRGVC